VTEFGNGLLLLPAQGQLSDTFNLAKHRERQRAKDTRESCRARPAVRRKMQNDPRAVILQLGQPMVAMDFDSAAQCASKPVRQRAASAVDSLRLVAIAKELKAGAGIGL